ncbi:CGNR zinc finger domain-containing protein [Actinomadura fibrosa]|uniref:CGNR zinc finger domain-containing protein n=2 Tax=Actinomadura fibrosa TaxID=111802 RepID=A0ABW2XV54_9ACTN
MEFTFVSGHLALDFAGTVQHRRADRRDLLARPADLARWTVAAGLLTEPPPAEAADLAAAVDLREAIYRAAIARLAGTGPADADRELINRAAVAAPPVPRLLPGGGTERAGGPTAALAAVARAAIDLLGGSTAGALKQCEADPCTRLYLDASRRGTRRWCDMRECGNRAKAAAFRARHRT